MAARRKPPRLRIKPGQDFSGIKLDGINLTDHVLSRVRFDNASLRRANLTRAEFRDCSFIGAKLDGAIMRRTVFENCDFTNATMIAANVEEAVFRATTILGYGKSTTVITPATNSFEGAVLDGSNFNRARLVAAKLHNVRAAEVDFSHCDLRNSSFDDTTLERVNFFGARLIDANFAKCPDARDQLPEYAKMMVKLVEPISTSRLDEVLVAHQRWLDTSGQEGERLNMRGMDLAGRKLDGYDFSGTDFRGARLDRASMKKVRLVAADLRMATMVNTNFEGADLRGAFLSPGALKRALLTDANFDPAALEDPETAPAASRPT